MAARINRLKPHGLPNTTGSGVVNGARIENLLALLFKHQKQLRACSPFRFRTETSCEPVRPLVETVKPVANLLALLLKL